MLLLLLPVALSYAATDAPAVTTVPAAAPSTPEAQYQLARTLVTRQGAGPAQYTEALKWYRKSAGRSYAQAQYELGQIFYDGILVKKDYSEAFKWFRKAAMRNMLAAQFYLGLCYQDGLGVKQSDAEAYYWLSLAKHRGWSVSPVLLDKSTQRLKPAQIEQIGKKVSAWKPAPAPAVKGEASRQPLASPSPHEGH
jgi:TPR repeat protein